MHVWENCQFSLSDCQPPEQSCISAHGPIKRHLWPLRSVWPQKGVNGATLGHGSSERLRAWIPQRTWSDSPLSRPGSHYRSRAWAAQWPLCCLVLFLSLCLSHWLEREWKLFRRRRTGTDGKPHPQQKLNLLCNEESEWLFLFFLSFSVFLSLLMSPILFLGMSA